MSTLLSRINWKNPHLIYGSIILVFVAVMCFFTYARNTEAKTEYPEKAKQLGMWIDEQSATYTAKEQEEAALQKQLVQVTADKQKAQETAKGYRYSLCNEFKLVREAGKFTDVADCASFQ